MTLRQLEQLIETARLGSITEAASSLFISQPSLSFTIRSLEKEFNIDIFKRTNKGVSLTREGEEFVGYARQVVEQARMMEQRYRRGNNARKRNFCVSAQHYSFVVEAFVALLREQGGDKYKFHLRETTTFDVIEDVARLRSQVGVLYLNKFNEEALTRTLNEEDLSFETLFIAKPHVFLGKESPLAKLDVATMEDLRPYPRLAYEQGAHNSFYFSEEIMSAVDCDKEIVVCDRATLFNMLVGMHGYTICSGVISEQLNGSNIVARPLAVEDYMRIGYILPRSVRPSGLTLRYLELLKEVVAHATQPETD
ncbi:MAG: LysR family transcriptional regulator [Planctomycetia bacterium]|nr:LysR family transcriptional regulator [Planctomycetia bacterium]